MSSNHQHFAAAGRGIAGIVLLLAGSTANSLSAQDNLRAARPNPAEILGAGAFRVPIHTAPDDPVGGAYGIWASEDAYKVGFDGGMEFRPALGKSASWPLRWRTTEVEVGGRGLAAAGGDTWHDDWRFEYRRPGFVEAYDVRADGVEQTFVFPKPLVAGDLVIRGAIDTALRAAPRAAQHGALRFVDDAGQEVVEYGAATVIDAAGRASKITTAFDGRHLELRVPAAWLASASYPITVDPLVQNLLVRNSSGYPVGVEIARDDESNELLIAYGRWDGNNETDCFVLLVDDDYSNPTLIFSDVTTSWKTHELSAGFIGGADRWLMAFAREFSSTSSGLRYRVHDKGVRQFSSSVSALAVPGGLDAYATDVGGTAAFSSGTLGLVVFSAGDVWSPMLSTNTEAYGVVIDAATTVAGVPFSLDASGGSTTGGRNREREYPSVIPESGGGTDPWMVVWQEFDSNITNDDWDIQVSRVSHDGQPSPARVLGYSQASKHSLSPKVAGRDGRYMVGFAERDNAGAGGHPASDRLHAQRFNWGGGLFPTAQPPRLVRQFFKQVAFPHGMSYDNVSESHWTFVSQGMSPNQVIYADVLGHRAGVCQAITVSPNPGNSDFSPAVTFNDDLREFKVVYGGTHGTVRGDTITYYDADTSLYGFGCGNGQIGSIGTPDQGAEFFTVRLTGVPIGTSAFLNLGLGATSVPLDTIGLPSCFLNTNPNLFITSFGRVSDAGGAAVQLPLPAPVQGDVFAQWVYLSPGANALGIEATQGLRIEVR